jgi:hypothetical protein
MQGEQSLAGDGKRWFERKKVVLRGRVSPRKSSDDKWHVMCDVLESFATARAATHMKDVSAQVV